MSTIIKEQAVMMAEISRLISEGKTVTITAKGYSMNPFIVHLQDQITLGPWEESQIKHGVVVLAKDSRGAYIIHRIIKREGDMLTLMGDGNIGITERAQIKDIIAIILSQKPEMAPLFMDLETSETYTSLPSCPLAQNSPSAAAALAFCSSSFFL